MSKTPFPKLNKSLIEILGPSIVFVSLALSGGEMLLWPDLVGRFGLTILWSVPLILLLQFAVNIEIERYSVATGENVITGLVNKFKPFKLIFVVGVVVSLIWPAWVLIAGNILAHSLNISQYGAWLSVFLLGGLIFIWFNARSYFFIESVARYGLIAVLIIAFGTIIFQFDTNKILTSFAQNNFLPENSSDRLTFLSALAFGGVTGVLNLVQSSWVINREYGAAVKKDNLEIDWDSQESRNNWKNWWKIILKEHFILFYLGNIIGFSIVSLLAVFTLSGTNVSGFNILKLQVDLFDNNIPFLGLIWGIGVFALFITAQITILDAAGQILHKSLQNSFANKLTNNQLSQVVGLIGVIILTVSAINPAFNQPAGLLQLSAIASAITMVIYPIFIIYLNYKSLPKIASPKLWNWVLVILCVVFYLVMSFWTFWH
jgi:hypothetical protein